MLSTMSSHCRNLMEAEKLKTEYVQIDGLTVLKIIKHCYEESNNNMIVAQGGLLGLKIDNVLEVTNSFPLPRQSDDSVDEEEYQLEVMRNLRKVNIDHLQVGWYQSTLLSNFLSAQFLYSHYIYQISIEDSIAIIFDPIKTSRGFLSLKAYRLTPAFIQLYRDEEFSADAIRKLGLGFDKIFYEVPIVIKNSDLMNALFVEIEEKIDEDQGNQYLDLGTTLQKYSVEVLENLNLVEKFETSETRGFIDGIKLLKTFLKHLLTAAENAARSAKGEPALPEEDINKLFKPIPPPLRLDSLISSGQIDNYCQQANQFSSQALGKLFVTEAFHG